MDEQKIDHITRVLECIGFGIYLQNTILDDIAKGVKEWKKWDKKHHLEEINTRKTIIGLLKKR